MYTCRSLIHVHTQTRFAAGMVPLELDVVDVTLDADFQVAVKVSSTTDGCHHRSTALVAIIMRKKETWH